jgi:hypothetical protein
MEGGTDGANQKVLYGVVNSPMQVNEEANKEFNSVVTLCKDQVVQISFRFIYETFPSSTLGRLSSREGVMVLNEGIQTSVSNPVKKNSIREKKEKVKMVVGKDVSISKIPKFWTKSIVGQFSGKVVHLETLKGWLKENWVECLGYIFFLSMF